MINADRISAFSSRYEDSASDWGGHSGAGSSPGWTIEYRAFLERFISMNNVRSIVDIGCGDWQFSRYLNLDGVTYTGYDVVESVVHRNRSRFGSSSVSFEVMPEDLSEVAEADLLIMKDVLQHLPDAEIGKFKRELFDRYGFCLISNSFEKIHSARNIDVGYGDFRCLDLNDAPYHFDGTYVFEFSSPLWERIRTLLYRGSSHRSLI